MTPQEEIAFHLERLLAAASEREREYHRDCIAWLEQQQPAPQPASKKQKRRIRRLVELWR